MNNKIFTIFIAVITVILLWVNYYNNQSLRFDDWRSNYVTGYSFEETPEYFKHLENRLIMRFLIQEALILVSGLVLILAVKERTTLNK